MVENEMTDEIFWRTIEKMFKMKNLYKKGKKWKTTTMMGRFKKRY